MSTATAPTAARPGRPLLLGLALVGITLLAYGPALLGGFIWNDSDYVTKPELRSLGGLFRIWTELGATEQYYPLLHSFFWGQTQLWGDNPLGFHLVNVLLHALNACTLAAILRRLGIAGAWLAAFLYALHPVCVESVAWISEQKNTFSTLLYLLAGFIYLGFDRERRPLLYRVATAVFILGLLAKSVTATLPGALLVVLWWKRGRLDWERDVAPLLPWFAVGAVAGLFTGWVERTYLGAQGAEFALTFLDRLALSGRIVWFYLGKLVWPAELIFIYPRWSVDAAQAWQWIPSATLLVLLAALWWLRRRRRGPLAALLFFLGSVFPVAGFFNVYAFRFSYVADHWQYLPCLGPIVFGAAAAAELAARHPLRLAWWRAGAAVVLAAFLVLSLRQSRLYTDIATFYRRTIAANPACWMAHTNLAILLGAEGRTAEAIGHFETALRLKPDGWETRHNMAQMLVRAGRLQEAATNFEEAIRHNPHFAGSYNDLGALLRSAGQPADARPLLEKAIRIKPDLAEAHSNLGAVLIDLRDYAGALTSLERARALNPAHVETHNNLGIALARVGRTTDAMAEFSRALELRPGFAEAHDNLGNTLRQLGRLDEAIRHYQLALQTRPDSPITLNNLGTALRETGKKAEAVEVLRRATQAKPVLPESHYNLALALFDAGRVAEAREHYRIARQAKPLLPQEPALEAQP